jgi:hypothetical protein
MISNKDKQVERVAIAFPYPSPEHIMVFNVHHDPFSVIELIFNNCSKKSNHVNLWLLSYIVIG